MEIVDAFEKERCFVAGGISMALRTWWEKDLGEVEVGSLKFLFSKNQVTLLILLKVFAGLWWHIFVDNWQQRTGRLVNGHSLAGNPHLGWRLGLGSEENGKGRLMLANLRDRKETRSLAGYPHLGWRLGLGTNVPWPWSFRKTPFYSRPLKSEIVA